MAIATCVHFPDPPPIPELYIPQFGILSAARQSLYDLPDISQYLFRLQDLANGAMGPLRRFLNLIEFVILIPDCFTAVIDALMPPSPGPIFKCIKKIGEALARLALFIPPLEYIPLIGNLADYGIRIIDETVSLFVLLDNRITEYKQVLADALVLGDLELAGIADCASGETRTLTLNAMDALKAITPLLLIIITPLARLIPDPKIQKSVTQLANLPELLENAERGIRDASGPPVLNELIQAMFVGRNILVVIQNIFAGLMNAEKQQVKSPPVLVNL